MDSRLRPYATAGIALAGAGVIAITPVAPPPTAVQVSSPAVNLSAAVDPIAPWVDAFNESSANATAVSHVFANAPGAALQQAVVNQFGYLDQLLNDPGSVGAVLQQLGDNLQKAFQTATILGLDQETAAPLLLQSNDFLHFLVASAIPFVFEPTVGEQGAAILTEVIRFLASPASGVLIGMVGPVISPAVAALNSAVDFVGAVRAGNFEDALQALVATPAEVVGSVFNGATLDLDFVLPLVSLITPEGFPVTGLNMAFGGLLTPGSTGGTVAPEGIGGSIVNSLGVTTVLGAPLTIEGQPVGPIGALTNLSQMIAKALGWDGTGNPLTKLTFPTIDPPAAPDTTLLKQPAAVDDPGQAPKSLLSAKVAAPDEAVVTADPEAQEQSPGAGEESSEGTAPDAPAQPEAKPDKVTTPKLRENPLRKAGSAVREGSDQVRRNIADLGKKLARDLKAPKRSAAKASNANDPSDKEKSEK